MVTVCVHELPYDKDTYHYHEQEGIKEHAFSVGVP